MHLPWKHFIDSEEPIILKNQKTKWSWFRGLGVSQTGAAIILYKNSQLLWQETQDLYLKTGMHKWATIGLL